MAQYADVRDDVRGSQATKRKRNDANDIRTDYVHSFVPDFGYRTTDPNDPSQPTIFISTDGSQSTDGRSFIFHGTHQPNFMLDNSDKKYLRYGYDPHVEYSPARHVLENTVNELKLKKRKHDNDPGYRGY